MEVPSELLSDAIYHEHFFSQLLDRLPQHLILPQTDKEEEESAAARFYKHRKLATPQEEKRKIAKEGKKARFDPENQLSISERQKERENAPNSTKEDDNDESDSENEKDFVDDVEDEDEMKDDDGSDSDDSGVYTGKKNAKGKLIKSKKRKINEGEEEESNRVKHSGQTERHSINVLKEKIAKRISEFRASRNLKEPGTGKPRHDRNSKPPKQPKSDRPNFGNKRKGDFGEPKEEETSTKQKALLALNKEKEEKVKAAQEAARKQVEESGDIQFTMLQVLDKAHGGNKKTPAPGSKVKRIKSLLMRAEEKEKKMEALKNQGEEGKEKLMAQNWKDTLKMATGEKVLEDKTKLKKALKRRDQQKKKSAKLWDQIKKDVEDVKNAKQDKRENNLRNRSNNGYPIPESNNDKETAEGGGAAVGSGKGTGGKGKGGKGKGGGKGGLSSAGFEGKKKGFLNKSK